MYGFILWLYTVLKSKRHELPYSIYIYTCVSQKNLVLYVLPTHFTFLQVYFLHVHILPVLVFIYTRYICYLVLKLLTYMTIYLCKRYEISWPCQT